MDSKITLQTTSDVELRRLDSFDVAPFDSPPAKGI